MATIKNQKVETPCTTEMNDKDYLNDILETEKNLGVNLAIALNEASNDALYKDLIEICKEIHDTQRMVFKEAFKNGWYVLEEAEDKKIKQKYDEFSKQFDELI